MADKEQIDKQEQTAPSGAVLRSGAAKPRAKLARSKLPRGIVEVRWENATVADSVRYRVRIKRKDFKADRLFDSLHEAQEFLLMSKTRDGRLGLTEREERARVIAEVAKEMLSRRPFSFYIGRYIAKYVDPMDESNEVKKHSKGVVRARILGLKNVLLTWKPPEEKERTGLLALHRAARSKSSKKPLGDFFLDEIDLDVANEFLTVRNKTHAASTVMRERGQLQTIWSKLRHLDPAQVKKLPPENPWQAADKALISVPDTTRERDLSDDEEDRMIASLAKCRNKLVPLVIGLALVGPEIFKKRRWRPAAAALPRFAMPTL